MVNGVRLSEQAKRAIGTAAAEILHFAPRSVQTRIKHRAELDFWNRRRRAEGEGFASNNQHFREAFLTTFGLSASFPDGKLMLDVGCGPRGSLEWASTARERVGVDPLVDSYRQLGIERHAMRYVNAGSEAIPFPDGYFDVVSAFNSLDHVEDLQRSLNEMRRVLNKGGDMLIITEINHRPTLTEPHTLRAANILSTGMQVVRAEIFAIRRDHDMYLSIRERGPVEDPAVPAILCAHLRS